MKTIKNTLVYVALTLYAVLYIIGTCVEISKGDLLVSAIFIACPIFIAGVIFGRWTMRKDQELRERIWSRVS
jgi:hypothetical protein